MAFSCSLVIYKPASCKEASVTEAECVIYIKAYNWRVADRYSLNYRSKTCTWRGGGGLFTEFEGWDILYSHPEKRVDSFWLI